ncbi:TWiK family of potassium channels protein 7 [Aphelenchoides bicaudatus]|nr:TWiK family of potassium channels protein 7 [Aphelenchoides bicaudatus]
MSANFMDSTQTWPKSRITKDLANEVKARKKLSNALDRAKAFVEETEDQDSDERTKEVRDLVQHLYNALEEQNNNSANNQSTRQLQERPRRASAMPASNLQMIQEEPQFGSMIWCDMDAKLSRPASRRASIATLNNPYLGRRFSAVGQMRCDDLKDGIRSEMGDESVLDEPVDIAQVYADLDPFYIRAIPHLLLFSCAIGYIFLGALFFQHIDEDLNKKQYKEIVLFTFQTCATIGWGNISPVRPWSRIACVCYAMFGIPLTMAAFANMGRLFTEFYCIDWIYITSVLRGTQPTVRDFSNQLPIKGALNMLLVHQIVGLLLFNGLIEDIGVVASIYFSMTSTATIGFGDIVPSPANAWELIVILTYASSGIIILSAVFISISYYIQLLYYGHLSNWLHSIYKPAYGRRRSNKVGPQNC